MPDVDVRQRFAEFAARQASRIALPKQPKVFFFIGRGRTGKTTNIRYIISVVDRRDVGFSVLDADTINPVLHQYVDAANTPPAYDEASLVTWMTECVFSAMAEGSHLLVDLGGGDGILGGLLRRTPDIVRAVEEMGGAVIACCTLGSSPDDLTPLANLHHLGFRPTATVLLFSEASLGANEVHGDAFASIQAHSFYRELIGAHAAIPLLIPRLDVAEAVERRRLDFEYARNGLAAPGGQPLTVTQSFVLRAWLAKMAEVYAPISAWFE